MRIRMLAVGTRMPDWVEQGVAEYRKRLTRDVLLDVVEIPMAKRGKNTDVERAKRDEAQALLAAIPPGDGVIALDVKGQPWSTEALSSQMAKWLGEGRNLNLLIGGPDGLAPECVQRADQRWSLSPLTLPHPLVRILVAEQLYRAWTLLNGHPYHR